MTFVRCGRVVLHADLRAAPGRPALVFANSLGTDARIWDAVVPHFADHAVLRYDKRGHGLSDAPSCPYDIDDHVADLLGLLDAFAIERFAMVGLSIGGMIAQRVAAREPGRVSHLVLCGTAVRIGTRESWDNRIAAVSQGGVGAVADAVLERWFTPAYRERETAAMQGWRNMLARTPAEGYAGTCATVRDTDLTTDAGLIRAPTLCLVGDGDLATPPDLVRSTAALIDGARFETIEGAGHIPCVEQPDRLAGLIARHLDAAS